jgi:alkylated DNA repair dioxygenase AlkB
MSTTLIQTEKSYLTVKEFKESLPLLTSCINEIENSLEIRPEVMLYGKILNQNRDVAFFSNTSIGYKYSGKLMASKPLTPHINTLLNTINELYKSQFNGILVNRYIDGTNYIGAHSDDESGLDASGVVALSYGTTRKFRIRTKCTKKIVQDIPMNSGEIIHMGGEFQKEFTHEIPVEKRVKGIRYSFTFRKHTV